MAKQTKPEMHQVAIVRFVDRYYNYGDDYDTFVHSITDWEEVDDETFKLLQGASSFYNDGMRFMVVERLTTKSPVVVNTVAAYVKHLQQQKEAAEKAAAEREAKAAERRLKKLAKDEAARRQLFEQLQREFNEQEKK